MSDKRVVIIGAGPAGLTAAYELTKHRIAPIVLEQNNKVGGIARTECYKGFYFDMGGHRFYTKAKEVERLWHEILGDDLIRRPRLSRIYYKRKFFNYPLKPSNALLGLGIWQAILVVASFIKWQIFPYRKEDTFEEWVTNRFGKRLFETFFKSYTEKIWGISTSVLKAEWAAQRIKDLSLKTALLTMFAKSKMKITTLIDEFHYPRRGPGMLWEAIQHKVECCGGQVKLNCVVNKIHCTGNRVDYIVISNNGSGEQIISGTDFVSSMPVSEFIRKLEPVPPQVLRAAERLTYRDFLTVCLIVNKPDLFPDNWIYIHAPEVRVGRIQNFKNWSSDMVPDLTKTSLGMEYFCAEGDELWIKSDTDLIELGKREIERIGLARYEDVEDGVVFRVPKAYPVYDSDYREYLTIVQDFVNQLEGFQTIGRNGLHRYNNQDHSMVTAMLAVRNLMFGERHDLWSVNTDQEYQEETREAIAPEELDVAEAFRGALTRVFSRLDPVALGVSTGLTTGLVLFLATVILLIKGGPLVGPTMGLLSNFFPGYAVTPVGSVVGFVYAFLLGFILGWGVAYARNLAVYLSAVIIHRDIELHLLRRFLDYM